MTSKACPVWKRKSFLFWLVQFLRGLVGIPLFLYAVWILKENQLWEGLGFLAVSLLIMKGCPVCWTFSCLAHLAVGKAAHKKQTGQNDTTS